MHYCSFIFRLDLIHFKAVAYSSTSTIYDLRVALSIYYLMIVRYNYHPKKFQEKIEPLCHAFALGAPMVIVILSLSMDMIGPTGQLCLLNDSFLLLLSTIIYAVIHVSINVFCMLKIFLYFYLTERRMRMYAFQGRVHNGLVMARKKIAKQAFFFVLASLITYIPPVFLFVEAQPVKSIVEILCSVLFPLQG